MSDSQHDGPGFGARWFRLPPRTPAALDAQLREELGSHLALASDHLVARGVLPADAERQARARFGDFDGAARQLYYSARRREARIHRRDLIDELKQDARLALRLFRRSPVFFAAAVFTLAIGIGANGAVFSILQAALLQPLPYRNPNELVMLRRTNTGAVERPSFRSSGGHALTSPMVLGWRQEGSAQLGEVAALLTTSGNLAIGNDDSRLDLALADRTLRLNGALATPNFFDLLGVRAARGRLFTGADETRPDAMIVLSDATWRRDFGGDPAIVGRPITLTTGSPRIPTTFIVAGILPTDFHFTYPDEVEAWVMMRWSDVERHDPSHIAFSAVARLRPGVTLTQARERAADLPTGFPRLAKALPYDRDIVGLESMHDWVVGETRPSLELLGAVAALLLIVTCMTVANALLARVSERQQELAVRAALGAGRSRLVRQLLTEGALLSIGGAVVGTAIAVALQPVLRSFLPASIPRVGEISVNVYVVIFGAAMAAVTTILAAIAPAWAGARNDSSSMLVGAANTASAARSTLQWRNGLIVAQTAIATALLISASLLLASFWQLGRVPLGFDGDRVVTVDLRLMDWKYMIAGWRVRQFQDDLLARLHVVPGIAAVGLTSDVPIHGNDRPIMIGPVGREKTPLVTEHVADAGYFRTLRIASIRGRLFDETDRDNTQPVTVISESYARKTFGPENPIGQMIGSSPGVEVVGVVDDVHYAALDRDPTPDIYIPSTQQSRPNFSIVARTDLGTSAQTIIPAIRQAIHELDPTIPVLKFSTIDQLIDASAANRRFYTVATAAFATIALLLTVVGLVVVVARVVAERRRELAIRAALGATMGHLARVATQDALVAASLGVLVGLGGAYGGAAILRQFLFHVAARSSGAYAGVAVLVLSVAMAAAWGPVRRFDQTPLSVMLKPE